MKQRFTPGSKSTILKMISSQINGDYSKCRCIPEEYHKTNTAMNIPLQSNVTRISNILSNSLGGKVQFGNNGTPIITDSLGNAAGQPGGGRFPIRNKF